MVGVAKQSVVGVAMVPEAPLEKLEPMHMSVLIIVSYCIKRDRCLYFAVTFTLITHCCKSLLN